MNDVILKPAQTICQATHVQMLAAAKLCGFDGNIQHEQKDILLAHMTRRCPFGYYAAIVGSEVIVCPMYDEYQRGLEAYSGAKLPHKAHALFYRGLNVAVYTIENGLLLIASDAFMSYELDQNPFQMGFDIMEDIICNSELEYNFNAEWSDEFVLNGDTYFDNQYAVRCWVETLHSVGYVVFDKWRG